MLLYTTKLTYNKCLATPGVHVDDGYSFPQLCMEVKFVIFLDFHFLQ